MKIKKILIKNFKNIKETRIIDFQENVTLFVGPNGFGKTTILKHCNAAELIDLIFCNNRITFRMKLNILELNQHEKNRFSRCGSTRYDWR